MTDSHLPGIVADMPNEPLAAQPTVAAITIMGSGRIGPTVAALLGLIAVVLGARALSRARRTGGATPSAARDRRPAVRVLGASAVLLGAVFLVTADGGPGTGNGVVGSVAAVALGSIAVVLERIVAGPGSHRSMRQNPIDMD